MLNEVNWMVYPSDYSWILCHFCLTIYTVLWFFYALRKGHLFEATTSFEMFFLINQLYVILIAGKILGYR